MKNLSSIVISMFFIAFPLFLHAQEGAFIAKDNRIAKFEKDIFHLLLEKKEIINVKAPINYDNYKDQVSVRKCLEIYSDTTLTNILLIRFSANSDHGRQFWGILTDNEKFFFSNFGDSGFILFKNKFDTSTIATITCFCKFNRDRL
jgi:hypothetical protein